MVVDFAAMIMVTEGTVCGHSETIYGIIVVRGVDT